MMKAKAKWAWRSLYAVLAIIVGSMVWHLPILGSYELATYDKRLMLANKPSPETRDARIIIVTIDDESLKKMKKLEGYKERCRWPWPSTNYGRAIENCFKAGAAVVGVDLLTFDTPSAPKYRHEDDELVKICERYKKRVVLAQRYDIINSGGMEREEWSLPLKPLQKVCRRGYVNVVVSPDGVVRKFIPTRKRMFMFQEHSFAVGILKAFHVWAKGPETQPPDDDHIRIGSWSLRGSAEKPVLIGFSKTPLGFEKSATGKDATRTVPYWRVLMDDGLDTSLFKDKIVLIGPTALDFHDRHPTPVMVKTGQPTQGVAIQADIISSFLRNSELHEASPGKSQMAAWYAGFIAFSIALFAGALWGPIALLAAAALYWAWSCHLMQSSCEWVEVARPMAIMFSVYLIVTVARLAGEERKRRQVRKMFSAYVSGEVLSYLEENPEAFSLTGERREVTVFFSDVQGFTNMSETVTPDVLASILNRYFTPMSELVMAEGGYVDKYIGDCVMAVFGVPQPLEDHAVRCCRSALRQMKALEELNNELKKEFNNTLAIRIGINTGLVSAGNMGSDSRFEYTVMGDVVNLGSRLEGANKAYDTRVMVGQNTYEAAKEQFEFRLLDLLRVKGKAQPVKVYELLGPKGGLSEDTLFLMERFAQGWHLYKDEKWDEAIEVFEEVDRGRAPLGDGPSKLYVERCQAYKKTPPPSDWAGVFVMKTK